MSRGQARATYVAAINALRCVSGPSAGRLGVGAAAFRLRLGQPELSGSPARRQHHTRLLKYCKDHDISWSRTHRKPTARPAEGGLRVGGPSLTHGRMLRQARDRRPPAPGRSAGVPPPDDSCSTRTAAVVSTLRLGPVARIPQKGKLGCGRVSWRLGRPVCVRTPAFAGTARVPAGARAAQASSPRRSDASDVDDGESAKRARVTRQMWGCFARRGGKPCREVGAGLQHRGFCSTRGGASCVAGDVTSTETKLRVRVSRPSAAITSGGFEMSHPPCRAST